MTIYILGKVTGASSEYKKSLDDYTQELEIQGHEVYLPHRDTKQTDDLYTITLSNFNAVMNADEVHVSYDETSKGSLFDMGMAFALEKPIKIIGELPGATPRNFEGLLMHLSTMQY